METSGDLGVRISLDLDLVFLHPIIHLILHFQHGLRCQH